MITIFKHDFHSKFKVYPTISYDLNAIDPLHLITLDALIDTTNILLNNNLDIDTVDKAKRSITGKCRKRLVVNYRGCMVHIARRLNYPYTVLAKALGACNHTSILHLYKRTDDFLTVDDDDTVNIYKELENELKTRYGTIRDVQSHSTTGTNP